MHRVGDGAAEIARLWDCSPLGDSIFSLWSDWRQKQVPSRGIIRHQPFTAAGLSGTDAAVAARHDRYRGWPWVVTLPSKLVPPSEVETRSRLCRGLYWQPNPTRGVVLRKWLVGLICSAHWRILRTVWGGGGQNFWRGDLTYPIVNFLHGFRPLQFRTTAFWYLDT